MTSKEVRPSIEKSPFESFMAQWDEANKEAHKGIRLFNPEEIKTLSEAQKPYFAKIFWHARAYFINFLWFLGNYAPDKAQKDKALDHIIDELGGDLPSHDQLYVDFAKSFGVDLRGEIIGQENYLPFLQDYNRKHLEWLYDHDWESRLAAFAAYERLDNVDYADLLKLAEALNIPKEARLFFEIHAEAAHYDMVNKGDLEKVWAANPAKVQEAFAFIGNHQIEMWRNLSDTTFGHEE